MTELHQSLLAPADNKFHQGNRDDGKHYWLTPVELLAEEPMREQSISDTLWELGVIHVRDEGSITDGCHSLYYAGRKIGRYAAYEVADLIREHGLDDGQAIPSQDRVAP